MNQRHISSSTNNVSNSKNLKLLTTKVMINKGLLVFKEEQWKRFFVSKQKKIDRECELFSNIPFLRRFLFSSLFMHGFMHH